jgi:hypothetical protein
MLILPVEMSSILVRNHEHDQLEVGVSQLTHLS